SIDRLQFKTPSLRNVALTPPYMHDGSINTLKEVVEFYNRAESAGELLPLQLDDAESNALVAFLESLTGERASIPLED
ncbi:MAG: cytochrome c peroxidase, partial [Verrucomicrobiales bacterium]